MRQETMAQTETTLCYQWQGVTWIPHYRQQGVYVAPGGTQKTVTQLLKAGADMIAMQLWPRDYA